MARGKLSFKWYLVYFIVVFIVFAAIWLGADYASNNKHLTHSMLYRDVIISAVFSLISVIGFYIQNKLVQKNSQR